MKKMFLSLILFFFIVIGKVEALKVGDYVYMTPTSTSYTVKKEDTGYTYDQNIYPNELNTWVIIKQNDDGTFDAVSEYISSVDIYFNGVNGYKNYIKVLNDIANAYINTNYIIKTRYMGYNNQTPIINNTSKITSTTVPWTSDTSNSTTSEDEALGAGDMGYTIDYDLVKNAVGTLSAKIASDKSTTKAYWTASRYYGYDNNNNAWGFYAREIDGGANIPYNLIKGTIGSSVEVSKAASIRPIVTFKENIYATKGNGTQSSPYTLALSSTSNSTATNYICKRATTLHTETCNSNNSSGCKEAGLGANATITYGNKNTNLKRLTSGDAFDCDVNGDGIFDSKTERFYYVSDLYLGGATGSEIWDINTAVLIYYSSVSNGNTSNTILSEYYSNVAENWHGPQTAITQLPTNALWKNITLKNNIRSILSDQGQNATSGGTLPSDFSYSGYAARLLTYQEMFASCGNGSTVAKGYLDSCTYLLENTKYSNDTLNIGYWLETPRGSNSDFACFISGSDRNEYYTYANSGAGYGVRPVIEVSKDKIQLIEVNNTSDNNDNNTTNNNTNDSENNIDSTDNKNEIDNPQTGEYLPYIVIGIGILFSGLIYLIIKRKNKIAKI